MSANFFNSDLNDTARETLERLVTSFKKDHFLVYAREWSDKFKSCQIELMIGPSKRKFKAATYEQFVTTVNSLSGARILGSFDAKDFMACAGPALIERKYVISVNDKSIGVCYSTEPVNYATQTRMTKI